jgi:hypothetical protein
MLLEKSYKADIDISASGDNTIIAAPTGTSVYLVIDHINLIPDSSVTMQIKDGSTSYGGAYGFTANQGFVLENTIQCQDGIITLSANSAFVLNLSSAVQVSGFVRYRIINK